VRELLGGEDAEHVRLVLRPRGGPVQLTVAVGVRDDRRVVAGRHRVEPEGDRLVEEGRELDPLVAAHARVGSAPGAVLGDEVVDDIGLEPLGEVPHVVGDAEHPGHALGVHRVLDGAASASPGPKRSGLPAEREMDSDDLMAGVDGARGRDRGVDSAAHRRQHLHAIQCRRVVTITPRAGRSSRSG
jgi:hypothetical protein